MRKFRRLLKMCGSGSRAASVHTRQLRAGTDRLARHLGRVEHMETQGCGTDICSDASMECVSSVEINLGMVGPHWEGASVELVRSRALKGRRGF